MKKGLTERQKLLLTAIIHEFMETAEAVGSMHLPDKYELNVSPATIRNEMVALAKHGYIKKAHASSGRIPTSSGYRLFIDELLDHMQSLAIEDEAQTRELIFQNRFDTDSLLYHTVRKLVDLTGNAGIATFGDRVYFAGIADMLDMPEYQQPRRLKQLLSVLEDYKNLNNIFEGKITGEDDVRVLIGEEDIGIDTLERAAIVFTRIRLHNGKEGYIAVIGPNRMDYSQVIPVVKWTADTINHSVEGWS